MHPQLPGVGHAGGGGTATALRDWLRDAALPRWFAAGVDPRGGFFEALGLDGRALDLPRRARVQPRQVFVFSHAQELGWLQDAGQVIDRGLQYIEAQYRRPDGFYRTLVSASGAVLDDRALLYDQAFMLLGFAAAARLPAARAPLHARALALRDCIARHWRVAEGEFLSGDGLDERRDANPHMHLLEACLAWAEISEDPGWRQWADAIAHLALARFLDPASGALFESYDARWRATADPDGPTVEPGHQYEWAWLLLRAQPHLDASGRATVLRLIDLAEAHGVRGGVAINVLDGQLAARDTHARLWVQTERLRACGAAFRLSGDERYLRGARQAEQAILPYLATALRGLWYDEQNPWGERRGDVVHASTLYHLVSAAREAR